MSNSRKFKQPSREVGTKTPKKKIVIYTEGEKTEYDYFTALKRASQGESRNVVVDIKIIEGVGAPSKVAKLAIEAAKAARHQNRRQSFASDDEFWAVFDCDEHASALKAREDCEKAQVGVAFSDPCFEVWLILHFEDYNRRDHRKNVQKHFGTLCPDYDHSKHKTTDFGKLMASIAQAEKCAEAQFSRRKAEGDPPSPPYTTVYELTRSIRSH